MLIAIDGPAASGKGLLGRRLAKRLGLVYLDTGLLYRYVGYKALEAKIDLEQAEQHDSEAAQAIEKLAREDINVDALEELDLGTEIVGKAASIASAIPAVREDLLQFQRDVAATGEGAVLDGRDIGTVVCPNADFKFFITASLESRAERRYKQLQSAKKDVIYSSVLGDLERRDRRDTSRKAAPLVCAEDAMHIDTTDMHPDEVLDRVLAVINGSSE